MRMLSLFSSEWRLFYRTCTPSRCHAAKTQPRNATRCTHDTLKTQRAVAQHATRQRYKRKCRSRNAVAPVARRCHYGTRLDLCRGSCVATLEMLIYSQSISWSCQVMPKTMKYSFDSCSNVILPMCNDACATHASHARRMPKGIYYQMWTIKYLNGIARPTTTKSCTASY